MYRTAPYFKNFAEIIKNYTESASHPTDWYKMYSLHCNAPCIDPSWYILHEKSQKNLSVFFSSRMSDTEIQTVATRSAPRTRANSRNNLSDVPIATPLLGETHGQISNLKNLRTKIEIGDTADIVDILKSRLSEKSQEVAAQQVNLVREINKIDQKLAKIDSRVEEKAKISINLSKEVAKFEAAEQVFSNDFFWIDKSELQASAKLSGSLRSLALRLNQINMSLPVEKRLEKLVFD